MPISDTSIINTLFDHVLIGVSSSSRTCAPMAGSDRKFCTIHRRAHLITHYEPCSRSRDSARPLSRQWLSGRSGGIRPLHCGPQPTTTPFRCAGPGSPPLGLIHPQMRRPLGGGSTPPVAVPVPVIRAVAERMRPHHRLWAVRRVVSGGAKSRLGSGATDCLVRTDADTLCTSASYHDDTRHAGGKGHI